MRLAIVLSAIGLPAAAFAGVAEPVRRFRIEALQQAIRDIQIAITQDIGIPLGISAGFNSLDGD